MKDSLELKLKEAVMCFWQTRGSQQAAQGTAGRQMDRGERRAVTGGRHCAGFVNLVRGLLVEAGLQDASIFERETALPGYFRPSKNWDLLVASDGNLIATLEFKSQVGPSFGNNFNNRVEEAIGSATDLWTAYREGAFKKSLRPWLGWFMILEDTRGATAPISSREPHFEVFSEFKDSSYARRYQLFCQRLVRERLYDAACLIMSTRQAGPTGEYSEPDEEIGFTKFAASLVGHANGYARLRPPDPER